MRTITGTSFLLLLLAALLLSSSHAAKVSSGSKSKGLGLVKVWKSFWLTLVDPSAEESLRDDRPDKSKGRGSATKKGLFKKAAGKGRKLK